MDQEMKIVDYLMFGATIRIGREMLNISGEVSCWPSSILLPTVVYTFPFLKASKAE